MSSSTYSDVLGVKHAFHGIIRDYKQYLSFFVAIFICQSLCFTLLISNSSNHRGVYDTVLDAYDYHVVLSVVTVDEAIYIENALQQAITHELPYTYRRETSRGEHHFYVTLGDPDKTDATTEALYRQLKDEVLLLSGVSVTPELSPLYTAYTDYIAPSNLLTALIAVILGGVSVLLLMFLYRIRIDHYKFSYGIYMAFGADFRRLFATAVTEMMVLSAMTLVPSFVFSFLAMLIVYTPSGIAFPAGQILIFLLFNFGISYLSVYLPMKHLSRRAPVDLISAKDNSTLVSSPRRSFRIFGKAFPKHYEIYSFVRFRKYYIRLVLTAALFSACFLAGIYLCRMYADTTELPVKEFLISVPEDEDEALDDCGDFVAELNTLSGISYCEWEKSTDATAVRGFMMMQGDSAYGAGNYILNTQSVANTEQYTKKNYEQYVDGGYTAATLAYSYRLYDKEMIDLLCESATVDGNPYEILEGTGKIILSEALFNRDVFDFAVGDTVIFAERVTGTIPEELIGQDERLVLEHQIKTFGIRFHEYTVCAVVSDLPADNRFIVGVGATDYRKLAKDDPSPETVSVYIDRTLSLSEVQSLGDEVYRMMGMYTDVGYTIEETGNALSAMLADAMRNRSRIVIWSVLILFLAPLIWFFSQILFYGKREGEFRILEAFGAYGEDIRNLHLWGGAVLALSAVVVSLLEGVTASALMFAVMNYFLPSIGVIEGIRYTFEIPFLGLLSTIVASGLFAFGSVFLPYLLYLKKRSREIEESDRAYSAYMGASEQREGKDG